MITIHQRHRRTDGRTDRQTTCDCNTALCTKVHRAVKTSDVLGVLVRREVEMFELVPKVRRRQCIVLETDRKSVPSLQYVEGALGWVASCNLVQRTPQHMVIGK